MYAKEAYFILFLKRLIFNLNAFFRIKRLRLWSISIHLCYLSNTISLLPEDNNFLPLLQNQSLKFLLSKSAFSKIVSDMFS